MRLSRRRQQFIPFILEILSACVVVTLSQASAANLPGSSLENCSSGFAKISSGQSTELDRFRIELGPELRMASDFEHSRILVGPQAWVPSRFGPVRHVNSWSTHGNGVIQASEKGADGKPLVYLLDGRLPSARKLLQETVLKGPPAEHRTIENGSYWLQEGREAWKADPAVQVLNIQGQKAWPTPEKLNQIFVLDRKDSEIRFVRATTSAMRHSYGGFSLELAEHLAAGQIPVAVDREYGKWVNEAYQIYQSTLKPEWPRIRGLMLKAIDIAQDPGSLARDRRAAIAQLALLQYEVVPSLKAMREYLARSEPDVIQRLAAIESRLTGLGTDTISKLSPAREAVPAPAALESPDSATAKKPILGRMIDRVRSALGRPAGARNQDQPATDRPDWLTRYRNGETAHFAGPLRMTPDDLTYFLDDWRFKETFKAMDTDDEQYLYWLKGQITHDRESSGSSMLAEGVQLRMWIYMHFPQLTDLEPPTQLTGMERVTWLSERIKELLGPVIDVPRVPLANRAKYQQEAIDRYFSGIFQDAFFGGGSGFRGSSGSGRADISSQEARAFSVLGLSPGASEGEIKKAYRKKIMALHPDRTGDYSEAAVRRAAEINDAYAALSRPSTP